MRARVAPHFLTYFFATIRMRCLSKSLYVFFKASPVSFNYKHILWWGQATLIGPSGMWWPRGAGDESYRPMLSASNGIQRFPASEYGGSLAGKLPTVKKLCKMP